MWLAPAFCVLPALAMASESPAESRICSVTDAELNFRLLPRLDSEGVFHALP